MERRKYDRVRVRYSASFSGRSYHAPGMVVGLSLVGCRALIGFLINPDEWLGLHILVASNGAAPLHVAKAEVRWLEGQEVGMEFIHMEWLERARLSDMIRTIEGAPEWRPGGDSDKG